MGVRKGCGIADLAACFAYPSRLFSSVFTSAFEGSAATRTGRITPSLEKYILPFNSPEVPIRETSAGLQCPQSRFREGRFWGA